MVLDIPIVSLSHIHPHLCLGIQAAIYWIPILASQSPYQDPAFLVVALARESLLAFSLACALLDGVVAERLLSLFDYSNDEQRLLRVIFETRSLALGSPVF